MLEMVKEFMVTLAGVLIGERTAKWLDKLRKNKGR